MAIEYTGSLQGKVRAHTPETLAATWLNAYVVLPNADGAPKVGTVEEFKGETKAYPQWFSATAAPVSILR